MILKRDTLTPSSLQTESCLELDKKCVVSQGQ